MKKGNHKDLKRAPLAAGPYSQAVKYGNNDNLPRETIGIDPVYR